MIWADFFPYVLPSVRNCPDPVLEHHIRLAAIDFCRRTLCWQQLLDPIEKPAADGLATEFDLLMPPEAEVVRLLSVAVDGQSIQLVEASRGVQLVRRDSGGEFAFTRDRKMVYIQPPPRAGATIEVEAALKPTLDATQFPDDLFDHYAQDIAHGAMATLMLLPKQDWTDLGLGAVHQESFDERIATVAAQVGRGFSRTTSRVKGYFF